MNRLTYALCVVFHGIPKVETVETIKEIEVAREVPGKPTAMTLYEAGTDEWSGGTFGCLRRKAIGYFPTCEQAHKAHPGADVRQLTAYRFGRRYFLLQGMTEITVAKAVA